MVIVSRRAARVGTAARACFICARRAAATAYVAVGPAARARAAALRGEQAKQEALTVTGAPRSALLSARRFARAFATVRPR